MGMSQNESSFIMASKFKEYTLLKELSDVLNCIIHKLLVQHTLNAFSFYTSVLICFSISTYTKGFFDKNLGRSNKALKISSKMGNRNIVQFQSKPPAGLSINQRFSFKLFREHAFLPFLNSPDYQENGMFISETTETILRVQAACESSCAKFFSR